MAGTPQILDQYGRPVSTRALKQEQAGPTTRGIRNPYGNHPAAGLTPGRLAAILRESIEGVPERYLELAEDMEERDQHYAGVLSIRKRQVSGLDITVDAASDDREDVAAADLIREIIDRDTFRDELVDVLDAIGKGFSATEIIWDTSEGQWRPSAFRWRDPRWFTFDPDDGETLLLREADGDKPLNAYGWIVHCAKVKSGLPIRGGIARAVAWSFMLKAYTVKDWAIFCEAYGQPLRLGKWHEGATDQDKEKLLRAVADIGTDFAAIIPQSMAVEFVQAEVSGTHDLYLKRADWLDQQVSKVVLGQTGTTDAIAGGHAVGRIHNEVRADIEAADGRQLAATLNRDLVRPLIDLNMGPQKAYPKIRIGRPDEVDLDKMVGHVAKLVPLGLKVGMSTIRDKIGLPDPDEDEELLVAPRQSAPVAGEPPTPSDPDQATAAALAALRAEHDHDHGHEDDAIDHGARDVTGDEWEAMVAPIVRGLEEELAAATSIEEARAILQRRRQTLDVTALTDLLARMTFQARLAGEVQEDLA